MLRYLIPITTAAALALAWALWPSDHAPDDRAISTVEQVRYDWPEGTGLRYRLDYQANNRTARFEPMNGEPLPPLTGEFALRGDLVLRSYGPVDGHTRLGLRLENLTQAQIKLLGKDVLLDLAAGERELAQAEAFVEVDDRGRVAALRFAPDSSHLFRNLAQLLVSELRVELGDGATWSTQEVTQHGTAETTYTRQGGAIERRRARYLSLQAATIDWTPTVDGVATAVVEANGPLVSVDGHENVRAIDAAGAERLDASSRFSLNLIERFQFAREAQHDDLVSYRPGEPARADDEVERHLDQRVDGLTADQVLNTLAEYGRFGKTPDHNRFMWRTVALLQRDPAVCQQLVGLFASGAIGDKGQLLVLDLLTSAGTPEAQVALRDALTHDAVQDAPKYGVMYQRVGLVQAPTDATVEFVTGRYLSPGPEGVQAAAYSLGATARMVRGRDADQAREIGDRLERDLNALEATQEHQQKGLLYALGNAAHGSGTIRQFANHEHPDLRYASAAALRHMRDVDSRSALLDLTADEEHRVAQRALRSLGNADLTAAELRRLRAVVASGQMNEVAYHGLVNLLTPYAGDPVAAETLRSILSQRLYDSRVKSRIRVLLGDA